MCIRDSPQPLDWFQVLEEFLVHIRRRYTEEVVSQWVFEMTFFLNDKPYFSRGSLSNLEVWKRGWGIIKAALPRARVAGPGLVCGNPEESERIVRKVLLSRTLGSTTTPVSYTHLPENSGETSEDANELRSSKIDLKAERLLDTIF